RVYKGRERDTLRSAHQCALRDRQKPVRPGGKRPRKVERLKLVRREPCRQIAAKHRSQRCKRLSAQPRLLPRQRLQEIGYVYPLRYRLTLRSLAHRNSTNV